MLIVWIRLVPVRMGTSCLILYVILLVIFAFFVFSCPGTEFFSYNENFKKDVGKAAERGAEGGEIQ